MAAEQDSMANEKIVIIEATVPTGFEEVAREEAVEKFGLEGRSVRGKITFRVPFDRVKQILQLGGIDNCRVQTLHIANFGFTDDVHDCLSRLQLTVKTVDWSEGLTVWKEFFSFEHPVASTPDKIPTDEELIDVCIMKRKPQPGLSSSGGKKNKHKKDKKKDRKERGNQQRKSTEESDGTPAIVSTEERSCHGDVEKDERARAVENGSESAAELELPVGDGMNADMGNEGVGSSEKKRVIEKINPSEKQSLPLKGETGDVAEFQAAAVEESSAVADGSLEVENEKADKDSLVSGDSLSSFTFSDTNSSTQIDEGNSSDGTLEENAARAASVQSPKSDGDNLTDQMITDDSLISDDAGPADPKNLSQEKTDSLASNAGEEASTPKRQRDPTKPTFRVTCNRAGEHHSFDSMSAAASFGSAVQTYFGWNVDMKNYDIEVILNVDNEEVSVGIGLTQASLHYRNLVAFGVTTLRPTICYNMLRMCKIRDGHVVCDPMCGTGSISIQGALGWPKTLQLCGENFPKALEKTTQNKRAIDDKRRRDNNGNLKMDVVRWDACRLPLRNGAVDIFVTDLPFGHRVGSHKDNRKLYPQVLDEMARVGRLGSRACLLTGDKPNFIRAIQQNSRYWQRRRILSVNVGGISAAVFLLLRTTTPYTYCSKTPPKLHGHAQSHDHPDVSPSHPCFTSGEGEGERPLEKDREGVASVGTCALANSTDGITSTTAASALTLAPDTSAQNHGTGVALTTDASTQSVITGAAFLDKVGSGVGGGGGSERTTGGDRDGAGGAHTTDAGTQSVITGAAFLD